MNGFNLARLGVPQTTPESLNVLSSVETAHSSHSFNDRLWFILSITHPQTRMRIVSFSSCPVTSEYCQIGSVDARKDAMRMNLNSRGRELLPVSFSSEGTMVLRWFVGCRGGLVVIRLPLPICDVLEEWVECIEGKRKKGRG